MTSSYVNDGAIMVATDSEERTKWELADIFRECDSVARGRGMSFSVAKTKWFGFGDRGWSAMEMMDQLLDPEEKLRILGFRLNVFNNFSSHVRYWLENGLGVRRRIAIMGRKLGEGSIGAWETFRLIQAAYLPVVSYGLNS